MTSFSKHGPSWHDETGSGDVMDNEAGHSGMSKGAADVEIGRRAVDVRFHKFGVCLEASQRCGSLLLCRSGVFVQQTFIERSSFGVRRGLLLRRHARWLRLPLLTYQFYHVRTFLHNLFLKADISPRHGPLLELWLTFAARPLSKPCIPRSRQLICTSIEAPLV